MSFGFESFVPLRKELHKWSDRKRLVEVPLIPSYVFVNLPSNNYHKAYDANGIVRAVMFNGRLAIVKLDEIELLRRVCRTENPVTVSRLKFRLKDEVEIISGLFAGYRGTVVQLGKQCKVGIQIKEIDFSVVVDVPHDQIRSCVDVPILS